MGAGFSRFIREKYEALINLFKKPPQEEVPINASVIEHYPNQVPPSNTSVAEGGNRRNLDSEHEDLERRIQELELENLKLTQKAAGISKRNQHLQLEEAKRAVETQEKRYKSQEAATLKWLREKAKEKIGLDTEKHYNICFAGKAGVGKSMLINALRGLKDVKDPGAAEVDDKECTCELKPYPHPEAIHLVLWDCPGSGTQDHPRDSYFYDYFLFGFDYLIFIFTDRFGDVEIDLMKQAIAHQVPFAVVRNKADDDFRTKRLTNKQFEQLPLHDAVDTTIISQREETKKRLQNAGISPIPPIFIISALALMVPNQVEFEEKKLIEFVLKEIYKRRNQD